jgi:hypothetical protein
VETSHNKVVRAVCELCLKYAPYKKVFADGIGKKYRPIVIHSKPLKGGKAETITYNPDVWAETTKGTVDVFEVWDTEAEAECVEDVLWFALTKNIGYLHIVCLNKDQEELAWKLDKIVLNSLFDEDGEPLSVHHRIIALVPHDFVKQDKKLTSFLYHELEFDR